MSEVKLYLGDCLDILPTLETGSVDLIVTSPPYDNLRTYNGYKFDFESIAHELFNVLKPGGILVWVVGDATIDGSETGTSFRQALYFIDCGFKLHDTMIYEKNGPPYPSQNKYYQIFEYMFILSKGIPKTVNLIEDRKNRWVGQKWSSGRTRRTVDGELKRQDWYVGSEKEYGVRFNIWRYHTGAGYSTKDEIAFQHPATFPEALARDHILSWSNPGDVIMDPLMGSGTTGKMAIKYNRNFIGIEISKEYYAIAEKRIKEAQLQLRMEI